MQKISQKKQIMHRNVEDKFSLEKMTLIMSIIKNIENNFKTNKNNSKNKFSLIQLFTWTKKCSEFHQSYVNIIKSNPQLENAIDISYTSSDQKQQKKEEKKQSKDPLYIKKRLVKEIQRGFRQLPFFNELMRIMTVAYFSWSQSYPLARMKSKQSNQNNCIDIEMGQIIKFLLNFQQKIKLKGIDATYFLQEDIEQELEEARQKIDEQYIYCLKKYFQQKKMSQKQISLLLEKWCFHKNLMVKKIQNSSNKTIIHMKKRKPRKHKYPPNQQQIEIQIYLERQKQKVRRHRKLFGCTKKIHMCPRDDQSNILLQKYPFSKQNYEKKSQKTQEDVKTNFRQKKSSQKIKFQPNQKKNQFNKDSNLNKQVFQQDQTSQIERNFSFNESLIINKNLKNQIFQDQLQINTKQFNDQQKDMNPPLPKEKQKQKQINQSNKSNSEIILTKSFWEQLNSSICTSGQANQLSNNQEHKVQQKNNFILKQLEQEVGIQQKRQKQKKLEKNKSKKQIKADKAAKKANQTKNYNTNQKRLKQAFSDISQNFSDIFNDSILTSDKEDISFKNKVKKQDQKYSQKKIQKESQEIIEKITKKTKLNNKKVEQVIVSKKTQKIQQSRPHNEKLQKSQQNQKEVSSKNIKQEKFEQISYLKEPIFFEKYQQVCKKIVQQSSSDFWSCIS